MISFKSPNHFFRFLAHYPCGRWSSLCSPGLRFIGFSSLSRSRLFPGPSTRTFMEVFKEALTHASATHERAAIRAEQKSYSYVQLIASALNISDILHDKKITTVHESCRTDFSPVEDLKKTGFLHRMRVGIVAKPSPEFVAGILGTWLCGGVAVPLALSYPEAELLHVMNDSDVSIILSTQEHRELMENVAAKCSAHFTLLPTVTCMPQKVESHEPSQNGEGIPISDLIAKINGLRIAEVTHYGFAKEGKEKTNQNVHPLTFLVLLLLHLAMKDHINIEALIFHLMWICEEREGVSKTLIFLLFFPVATYKYTNECNIQHAGDDPALILYTSGTTGKPKGVCHTHKSIIAQVQSLTEAWEYTTTDQFLHCLPLHHVHGLFNALFAPLYAGSVVDFMPKFSVRGIWQRWRESYPKDGSKVDDAITVFTGVPTMYTRLLQGYETMDPDQRAASSAAAKQLRLMMCGSSALPYPVMKQWEEITGHRLLERYGMTEFVMALSNPLHGNRKGGTVGKPLPRVEVKIIAEDESEIKAGVGELCVKSPSLFKEYWKKPMITRESFTGDGFFKTGDTVTVDDDGYYIILGRTNADIMKVGGYKLSALEIEAVLLEHEVVSECCVLGLHDKDYGEVVCAIVVPQEDIKLRAEKEMKPAISLEELRNWSKERLAPYKIPTRLFLWDSLPRNAMGKVNKKELKKLLEGKS